MPDHDWDRARAGPPDVEADFEAFYRRTFAYVFKAALREAGWHRQAAEDATQQAYAVLLTKWNEWVEDPAVGRVLRCDLSVDLNRAYVRGIAVKQVLRWRREHRRQTELPEHVIDVAFVTQFDTSLVRDEFLKAIEDMPRRQRQVVSMMFLDDLTPVEIAERLRISDSTVRTHLDRARDRLEPYVKKLREEDERRRAEDG
jgi:RNA polymerase sigma-70 factor (ECF subfamily)